ncbi:MAG: TatD family hydrolase [Oscillospiraceae bacterium]
MALYFDSHAHYDDERFDGYREQVLSSLAPARIGAVLNAASDVASSEAALALANSHDFIWASAGVHPHEAATLDDAALLRIASLCGEERVVALGEIGLDYYYDLAAREVQKVAFARLLQLALEVDLPVIIHRRDAAQDTLELVKKYRPRGIVHCFSGSAELAREYVSMGMYLGFTGVVTFANAKKPLEAAREVPLSQLLIETDCPYLAPVPFRGKRCDSTMLPYTAAALAAAKGVETEVLIQATWENAHRIYQIPVRESSAQER